MASPPPFVYAGRMLELIELHAQALAMAKLFHLPYSMIELGRTYFWKGKERAMQNYRVYTGPTLVQAVAEKLRTVDTILVTLEGTEHVYVKAPSVRDVLSGLVPMSGWDERDVREMPN